jgi:hypothetical protein
LDDVSISGRRGIDPKRTTHPEAKTRWSEGSQERAFVSIPGRAGCFKHRRPDRRTRAGPGVSPRARPGPEHQRLSRRVRARWLAGSLARGKSSVPSISASKKQTCEKRILHLPWNSGCLEVGFCVLASEIATSLWR